MIPIRNIYYMLSYAFSELRGIDYRYMNVEHLDTMKDLCACILTRAVSLQLKRGLMREYITVEEDIMSPKGTINITSSITSGAIQNHRLICSYDEFSENSIRNRVVKQALSVLLVSDVKQEYKTEIRKLLRFFADVDYIDPHAINWTMAYDRNNQTYRFLMAICKLVLKDLLMTQDDGSFRMMDLLDDRAQHKIYEKFILRYYEKEWPQLNAKSSQIKWGLDDDDTPGLLPTMQSDIMLNNGHTWFIIDAKFYNKNMQKNMSKETLISSNLYQIIAYVQNKKYELAKSGKSFDVVGMLLYARTDDSIQPDGFDKNIMGNRIMTMTLDLNQEPKEIASQLNTIATTVFGISHVEH